MKFNSKILMSVSLLSLLLLSGCGDTSTDDEGQESTEQTYNFVAPLGSGYIEDAKVCIDKNMNFRCDPDEDSAMTDSKGRASIMLSSKATYDFVPLAEVTKGKSVITATGLTAEKDLVFADRVQSAGGLVETFEVSAYKTIRSYSVGNAYEGSWQEEAEEQSENYIFTSLTTYKLMKLLKEKKEQFGKVSSPTNSYAMFAIDIKICSQWDILTQQLSGYGGGRSTLTIAGQVTGVYTEVATPEEVAVQALSWANLTFYEADFQAFQEDFDNGTWANDGEIKLDYTVQ